MDLKALPFDFELVLAGEAVDTRLADVTEGSDEIGVNGHARRHGPSVSLYSRANHARP